MPSETNMNVFKKEGSRGRNNRIESRKVEEQHKNEKVQRLR
jgi:hypothetical protein